MQVLFYKEGEINESLLKYAVMITKYNGKWVFCKHKSRSTWECPGGHIEPGETALEAGRRELYEETGAKEFTIEPISVYSVIGENGKKYGMLYYAQVMKFGELPEMEIGQIQIFDKLPENWTYPLIQPVLLDYVSHWLLERNIHGY